ncbi:MAG: hypothetical protein JW828_12605 [Sedimentisphaerales bacterium]|nr:hypothetical protein [Sedimentisphaerales bacterium]
MRGRLALFLVVLFVVDPLFGQVVLTGRYVAPPYPGSDQTVPMTAVHVFAAATGANRQAIGFRTWETHPAGWYTLSGAEGNYSIVFSDPAGFVRPQILTNQFVRQGDVVDRVLSPVFDYADLDQGRWDEKPAADYWQTFTAKGTSITQVGFKLATDGVDGPGPLGQNILISIHKTAEGSPDTWPQVGLDAVALNVDCGGAKNYWFSAGWDSGQVPTQPGLVYAVHLRPEKKGNSFQAFWRIVENTGPDCYRIDKAGEGGWQHRNLCMTIGSDSDGLLIPYNKRVHKKFETFGGFDRSWSQTYIAKGRGLAAVMLYAATSGVQPSLMRQRVKVRVREDGPAGRIVGVEKIAIGNGNYTGDASWGMFGTCFAPGEAPLEPGRTYAIEFESIENYNTLHGYVNIKGMVSDDKPGFNPYRKNERDGYECGTAYRNGKKMDLDLDMQIIEYEHPASYWPGAITGKNLLVNGDMQRSGQAGLPDGWGTFAVDPGTEFRHAYDEPDRANRIARIIGGSAIGRIVDGGFVQRVGGLSKRETYRLHGTVRSTWPVDEKHVCMAGYDPTGQTSDAEADSIVWTILPAVHGLFVPYQSEPIRPVSDSISVWLRGRTTLMEDYRFEADFDEFTLRKVDTGVPLKQAL